MAVQIYELTKAHWIRRFPWVNSGGEKLETNIDSSQGDLLLERAMWLSLKEKLRPRQGVLKIRITARLDADGKDTVGREELMLEEQVGRTSAGRSWSKPEGVRSSAKWKGLALARSTDRAPSVMGEGGLRGHSCRWVRRCGNGDPAFSSCHLCFLREPGRRFRVKCLRGRCWGETMCYLS